MKSRSSPSSGRGTRRNVSRAVQSGGTIRSGVASPAITSKAVEPTGLAAARSPSGAHNEHGHRPAEASRPAVPPSGRETSLARDWPRRLARRHAAAAADVNSLDASAQELGEACAVASTGRAARLLSTAAITRHEIVTSQMSSFLVRTTSSPVKDTAPCSILSASGWPPSAAEARARPRRGQARVHDECVHAWPDTCEPKTSACQTPPIVARCSPPAVVLVRSSRSSLLASRRFSSAASNCSRARTMTRESPVRESCRARCAVRRS